MLGPLDSSKPGDLADTMELSSGYFRVMKAESLALSVSVQPARATAAMQGQCTRNSESQGFQLQSVGRPERSVTPATEAASTVHPMTLATNCTSNHSRGQIRIRARQGLRRSHGKREVASSSNSRY